MEEESRDEIVRRYLPERLEEPSERIGLGLRLHQFVSVFVSVDRQRAHYLIHIHIQIVLIVRGRDDEDSRIEERQCGFLSHRIQIILLRLYHTHHGHIILLFLVAQKLVARSADEESDELPRHEEICPSRVAGSAEREVLIEPVHRFLRFLVEPVAERLDRHNDAERIISGNLPYGIDDVVHRIIRLLLEGLDVVERILLRFDRYDLAVFLLEEFRLGGPFYRTVRELRGDRSFQYLLIFRIGPYDEIEQSIFIVIDERRLRLIEELPHDILFHAQSADLVEVVEDQCHTSDLLLHIFRQFLLLFTVELALPSRQKDLEIDDPA